MISHLRDLVVNDITGIYRFPHRGWNGLKWMQSAYDQENQMNYREFYTSLLFLLILFKK